MNYKNFILAGMCVMLAVSTKAVTYTVGDTWLLEGATQWTNQNPFVGLGTIAALGGADTTKVWSLKVYTDVYLQNTRPLSPFKDAAVLLNYYSNNPTLGPYLYTNSPQTVAISPTNMLLGNPTWGPRAMPAVAWESPIQGTVRLTGTLSYLGCAALTYDVFLEKVGAGKFYQLTNGFLASEIGQYTNTLNVVVSLDRGDRLFLVNRVLLPSSGYEYFYSSGYPDYFTRWEYHRNLTVTFDSSAMVSRPDIQFNWRRADVWCRADLEGGSCGDNLLMAYDRRDPSAPARYYVYYSYNLNMDLSGTTSLTNGEILHKGPANISPEVMQCSYSGARSTPPVWFFRPPKQGIYQISGVLTNLARNSPIATTRAYIGTAVISDWGASNPVVSNVSCLWAGPGTAGLSTNLNLETTLPTINSAIFMTVSGEGGGGTLYCTVMDRDIIITRIIPKGTVFTGY